MGNIRGKAYVGVVAVVVVQNAMRWACCEASVVILSIGLRADSIVGAKCRFIVKGHGQDFLVGDGCSLGGR